MDEERVACRTPTQGREGHVNIPTWKYKSVRRAILNTLDESETGRVRFKDLTESVRGYLSTNELAKLGSVGWHVTTVKLNMEVEGELERVASLRPQTLQKCD